MDRSECLSDDSVDFNACYIWEEDEVLSGLLDSKASYLQHVWILKVNSIYGEVDLVLFVSPTEYA